MSRLIDAVTLRAEFTGNFREMWHYTGIWAMIDCAPTAYDIDKVVEQLEEKRKFAEGGAFEFSCFRSEPEIISEMHYGMFIAYENAIKIVKGGAE